MPNDDINLLLDRALKHSPKLAQGGFRTRTRRSVGLGAKHSYTGSRHTNLVNPADILTPAQVAERLQVPETWVYAKTRKRCQNPIPFVSVGRFIRFDWPSVVRWLRQQSNDGTEEKS